jgi:uncharacterized protein (UPF0332 family)
LKTEAAEYLAKARECLDAAKKIAAVGLPQVAAKKGYLAAYHAAHAFVFENTGQVVKTHSGMRAVFARLAKDDSRIDRRFTSFLAQAYTFKEVADSLRAFIFISAATWK